MSERAELIEDAGGGPSTRRRRRLLHELRRALLAARRELLKPLVALLAVVVVQQSAALAPGLVENFYARSFYPHVARSLSRLTGGLPFSVGEALLILSSLLLLAALARLVYTLARRRAEWRALVLKTCKFGLWLAAASASAFMLVFGLNYQRPPLVEVLGYDQRRANADELDAMTRAVVEGVNRNYEESHADQYTTPDTRRVVEILKESYARESEANFVAFLVCAHASDPFVRYSGYRQAFGVAFELYKLDPPRAREILKGLSPGYREDSQRSARFWLKAGGRAGDLSRRLNDFYLKANRVKSGTKNYGEVTALLIGYFLKSPPATPPSSAEAADGAAHAPTTP